MGFVNNFTNGINRNADLILTCFAVGGLVTTVVLAVKETPSALDILDDYNSYKEDVIADYAEGIIDKEEALYRLEKAQKDATFDMVRNYMPAGISLLATTGCIIGSNKILRTRNAFLTTSLNAANVAYNELRDKTRETLGEKKEQEIHDAIQRDHIERQPKNNPDILPPATLTANNGGIIQTGGGNTLCRIELVPGLSETGLYFYSSPQAVHKAINDANGDGLSMGYVSFADLLWYMGIKIKYGGTMMKGWRICSRDDFIQIREGSFVHPITGEPVLDISFYNNPYEGFDRFG